MIKVQEEQKGRWRLMLPFLLLAIISCLAPDSLQAQSVGGFISRIGDTTHIEFRGRQEWVYQSPEKSKDQIRVVVPAFDDATVVQLQAWTCPLIKEVKVNKELASDGKYEVVFSLKSDKVESFDYLTDDPSYLVLDFYEKKLEPDKEAQKSIAGTTTALPEKTKKSSVKKTKTQAKKSKSSDYKKHDRSPASSELLIVDNKLKSQVETQDLDSTDGADVRFESGVFDGGDPNYDRFRIKNYEKKEASLIASQQNIYLRYPMLLQKLSRLEVFKNNSPEYEIEPTNTEENKVARLLITLFNKKRYGAFFKTAKYFESKFPNSNYDEIYKNLLAESHRALYERDGDIKDFNAFQSIHKYLIDTYPDSIMSERNSLVLLYYYLDRGDSAEALQQAQLFLQKFKNSKEVDYVKFAMAESYLKLNRPDEAIQTYQEVINQSQDKSLVIEAHYRVGDVHAEKQKYSEAIEAYNIAHTKYPEHKVMFPSAQYNKSEALFWLGKNTESLDSYIEFVKIFPQHRHGGFALTRVGELLEILGADPRRVMGAFIEGYFRFPDSQGSEVARIRMLSSGLKNMQDREKKRAIEEIDAITKKSTLPKIAEFSTLMKADGLAKRTEYEESLNLLLSYYQNHPTTANLKTFKGRILRNISDILRVKLDKNEFIEALNFYGKYAPTWLKSHNRVDISFYEGVAYEKAGVPKEASKIYQNVLQKINSIEGQFADRERAVYENFVDKQEVSLRLAAVALTERRYRDSYNYLSALKLTMSADNEIEKAQIGAEVARQMGDSDKAIEFLEKLVDKYKGEKVSIVEPKIQLASIYLSKNRTSDADKNLSDIEALVSGGQKISDESMAKVLNLRGDQQLVDGQKLAAVETYVKLLENFENKYPLDSVRYKAGQILFDEGDIKGAEKIWNGLSDKTGAVYKKLAFEKLGQAEWSDSYKKYVDRIPAAEKLK